jgi:hypothetical protein
MYALNFVKTGQEMMALYIRFRLNFAMNGEICVKPHS